MIHSHCAITHCNETKRILSIIAFGLVLRKGKQNFSMMWFGLVESLHKLGPNFDRFLSNGI